MKQIIILFLCLFYLHLTHIRAQQAFITIINEKCPDSTYLSFGRPLDNNPSHFMQAADFFIFKNHHCPKQRIILCPEDSIIIRIKPDGNLVFEGTNADGNNLLKDQNMLTSGIIDIERELKLFSSAKEIISALEQKKQTMFTQIYKLYEDKRINKDFLDFSGKEFDMVFCNAIGGKIFGANLTEKEKKKVLCHFYAHYNPFDSHYAGTSMRKP